MAEPFHLLIVAPGKTIFDGKAESAVIPAADGMMGILPGHAPFYGTLGEGAITARTYASAPLSIKVTSGVVQVLPDEVTILAESCESPP